MISVFADEFCGLNRSGPAVVTVGSFDGVHLGHQKILERVKANAAEGKVRTLVTFEPHPQLVMHGRPGEIRILTSTPEKMRLLCDFDLDRIYVLSFNPELSQLSAEDFITEILVGRLQAKKLVMGYNHTFGRGREGNLEFLEKNKERFGLELEVVAPHYIKGEIVSSSKIRKALESGDVDKANQFLGRPYRLEGSVVTGQGKGRDLHYPTANLKIGHEAKLVPFRGVYAVAVETDDRTYPGMLNIGTRPTFGEGECTVEVHLIGFSGDLYGKTISMAFLKRLRDEKRYGSAEELTKQMTRDMQDSLDIYKIHQSSHRKPLKIKSKA